MLRETVTVALLLSRPAPAGDPGGGATSASVGVVPVAFGAESGLCLSPWGVISSRPSPYMMAYATQPLRLTQWRLYEMATLVMAPTNLIRHVSSS